MGNHCYCCAWRGRRRRGDGKCAFNSFILVYVRVIPQLLKFILCSVQPPKVRQRFTLKPKTPHIVCMRSIPGIIEQSRDFANSSVHTHKTDWVSASLFTGSASSSSPSYLVQRRFSDSRQRLRPKSASFTASRENGGFLLASTPDLSSMSGYSEAAVPVDIDLFSSTSPGMCRIGFVMMVEYGKGRNKREREWEGDSEGEGGEGAEESETMNNGGRE